MASVQVYHAVGKRKNAIARVYLQSGNGHIQINGKDYKEYFSETFRYPLYKPFQALEVDNKFDLKINVLGGGVSAQSEACMYGISKALTLLNPENRQALKRSLLLTRDARVVERKKYGHKKARKSFQFSKR